MAIKDLRDNLKRLKDADPIELAGQVNTWFHESGEALRERIEDEVERAVTNRGFVKRSEYQKLEARISELEVKLGKRSKVTPKTSKSSSSNMKKSGSKKKLVEPKKAVKKK